MYHFIRRNRHKDRRGATLVEFAIVAPVFFVLVFACIEFIRLNMIRNLVQDAAYFAARDAMVPGASADEAEARAAEILSYMNTQGAEITINDGAEIDDDTDLVTVTISVPVSENSFLVPSFTGDITLSSTAEMKTERYSGYYDSN